MDWQPIETAPRDGTDVIAWDKKFGARQTQWRNYGTGSPAKAAYDRGDGPRGAFVWREPIHNWVQDWRPTHWMPLPDPPETPDA